MIQGAGFTILKTWQFTMSFQQVNEFYTHLKDRPFFNEILHAMTQLGPVQAVILQSEGAIERLRQLVGPTDPAHAPSDTIRGKFGLDKTNNAVHASDGINSLIRELAIVCNTPTNKVD